MRVFLQIHGPYSALVARFDGACAALRGAARREIAICRSIEREAMAGGAKAIVIDLRDLVHIDGTCLRSILAECARLSGRFDLRFVGPGPGLRRTYRLIRKLPPLTFHPTIRSALDGSGSCMDSSSGAWIEFLSERSMGASDRSIAADYDALSAYSIDLVEEEDYLRTEGSTVRTPPKQPIAFERNRVGAGVQPRSASHGSPRQPP
jgi:anti-anti-sigma regulatory factor